MLINNITCRRFFFYKLLRICERGGEGGGPRAEFRGAKIQRYGDTEIRTRWAGGERRGRRLGDRPNGDTLRYGDTEIRRYEITIH